MGKESSIVGYIMVYLAYCQVGLFPTGLGRRQQFYSARKRLAALARLGYFLIKGHYMLKFHCRHESCIGKRSKPNPPAVLTACPDSWW